MASTPNRGLGAFVLSPRALHLSFGMAASESSGPAEAGGAAPTKCGYVTLLGAPNVGKSALMNTLLGEELSIVTAKAQTTWQRVTGIRTEGSHQLIFLDTPGVLAPRGLLHRSLLLSAQQAVDEADIVLVICNPLHPSTDPEEERLRDVLDQGSGVRIGLVNKIDAASSTSIEAQQKLLESLSVRSVHLVSALRGDGCNELLKDLEGNLPAGPFLYPEDEVASAPVRFFVAEMVRQGIFEQFHEEIPYASICRVEEFREAERHTYIQVNIYVERESQKGILVGDRGQAIRSLGTTARKRIEDFLDRSVYLDLWVKVLAGWRRKPEQLRRLGLPVPRDEIVP